MSRLLGNRVEKLEAKVVDPNVTVLSGIGDLYEVANGKHNITEAQRDFYSLYRSNSENE